VVATVIFVDFFVQIFVDRFRGIAIYSMKMMFSCLGVYSKVVVNFMI
jgi:hypothetical protein